MSFLRCLGTAPAAAPAVAVPLEIQAVPLGTAPAATPAAAPALAMPLEIRAAPITAAPMHTITPLWELSSTLLS